jgi:hypothetical protein
MPQSQSRTPEEEADRRIEAINRLYRQASKSVYQLTDQTRPLVPLEYASRVRGRIVVTGKDSELFSQDWVWVDLNYKVEEKFVGYLIVTEYYDPKTRRIADQKDYAIHSISTDIKRISQSGKQCTGYIPRGLRLGSSGCLPQYTIAYTAHRNILRSTALWGNMIANPDESKIISSLGWADKGNLWVLETSSGNIRRRIL